MWHGEPVADSPLHDMALLDAWCAGDQSAGDALVRRHYARVFRFFDIKTPAVAEDLTQRTFLGCIENRHRFRRDSTFRAYLFGIARKQLLRHLERPERHEAFFDFEDRTGALASPSSIVAHRDEQRMLLLALDALPPDLEIAIQLFYWEALSTSEIAEVLDINVSAVTTRLSRARQRIKEHVLTINRPGHGRDALLADIDGWTRSLLEGAPRIAVKLVRRHV
jgi:RNA polymerase sigma-70 factor (ECF subfamily)